MKSNDWMAFVAAAAAGGALAPSIALRAMELQKWGVLPREVQDSDVRQLLAAANLAALAVGGESEPIALFLDGEGETLLSADQCPEGSVWWESHRGTSVIPTDCGPVVRYRENGEVVEAKWPHYRIAAAELAR